MIANGGWGTSSQGTGGQGGLVQLFLSDNPARLTKYLKYSIMVISGNGGVLGSSLRRSLSSTSNAWGIIILPICDLGYGSAYNYLSTSPSTVSDGVCKDCYLCIVCSTGMYKAALNNDQCSMCQNAPQNSFYYSDGPQTNADCPNSCLPGFVTSQCYNQLQNFLYNVLTIPGTVGSVFGLFIFMFGPLLYFRLKKKNGWFENKLEGRDGFFTKKLKQTCNLIGLKSFFFPSGPSINKGSRYREDIRRASRLNDHDLNYHSCRINLLGSNSPFKIRGNNFIFDINIII